MTVTTENVPARLLDRSGKDRPGRELVVEMLFAPPANIIVRALAPLRMPPPVVVLANAAAGLLAALALARGDLVLAALLLQLKTLLDNVDGQLARATHRVDLVGRYLDTEADLVVNAATFVVLATAADAPGLALAAFLAITVVLSASFNVNELHREAHGDVKQPPQASGGLTERVLELFYRAVFVPQDRLLRAFFSQRLERLLAPGLAEEHRRAATLAYYDRFTVTALANLGLSTQLVVLGACLLLGEPAVYLWFALAAGGGLVLLQLRREQLVRRALRPKSLAMSRRAA